MYMLVVQLVPENLVQLKFAQRSREHWQEMKQFDSEKKSDEQMM